jgi:hypothetical protein
LLCRAMTASNQDRQKNKFLHHMKKTRLVP